MLHKAARVLLVTLVLGATFTTRADVIHTSDGSRLVGTIERWSEGTIVLVTQVAGRLEIDATKVTAVETDRTFNIQFDSGDRLVGTVETSPDLSTSVIHTAVGDIVIAPQRITSIWPVGAESPEVVAVRAETAKAIEALKPKWTVRLEAGGSSTEGNTKTIQARGRFDIKRKTKDEMLNFYLAPRYNEQNDIRTTNEYKGGVWYERSLTDRWHWFTRIELEFDEFENLDLRSTASVGAGYYWLKKDDHELKTRLGLGYRHESFNNNLTTNAAVTDVGLDYRIDLAPWVQFTHSGTYSPNFQQFGDYRLFLDTALLFPFQNKNVKLKLGITNDYNSRPQPGIDRLDNTYYANIVLDIAN